MTSLSLHAHALAGRFTVSHCGEWRSSHRTSFMQAVMTIVLVAATFILRKSNILVVEACRRDSCLSRFSSEWISGFIRNARLRRLSLNSSPSPPEDTKRSRRGEFGSSQPPNRVDWRPIEVSMTFVNSFAPITIEHKTAQRSGWAARRPSSRSRIQLPGFREAYSGAHSMALSWPFETAQATRRSLFSALTVLMTPCAASACLRCHWIKLRSTLSILRRTKSIVATSFQNDCWRSSRTRDGWSFSKRSGRSHSLLEWLSKGNGSERGRA